MRFMLFDRELYDLQYSVFSFLSADILFVIFKSNGMPSRQKEHFRHRLLFPFNQGVKASEAIREICEVYGDETMPHSRTKNWF